MEMRKRFIAFRVTNKDGGELSWFCTLQRLLCRAVTRDEVLFDDTSRVVLGFTRAGGVSMI